jgi:hypothetical protein
MARQWHRVKFATATTGTGSVTVGAAAPGYRTPATAGVPNGEVVSYLIVDGTAWEVGHSIYNSGLVLRALDESSTGSLLSLTGNAIVLLTPLVGDFAEAQAGSNFIYAAPAAPSGDMYLIPLAMRSIVTGTGTITINVLGLQALYIPRTKTYTEIAMQVGTAAGAGAVAQIGLYNADQQTMQPTTRLVSSGDIPTDTIGKKVYGFSQKLLGGTWYYLAHNAAIASPTYYLSLHFSGSHILSSSVAGLGVAMTYTPGGLPADVSGTDFQHISVVGGNNLPKMGIR